MEFETARPFLERHHWGVVTTHQHNGAAQSSIVFCGAYQDHVVDISIQLIGIPPYVTRGGL